MMQQILALDPQNYSRHRLHEQEREWAETNCYVDVWIELLHSWGLEPIAALPFTLGIDFEGDQWTFFKFPLADLYELYSMDVQEMAVWRSIPAHLEEQLSLGRPVLVELDSFYLPDTAGSAYKLAHVKTTVAVVEIDSENKRLGYFHGQGYYHLHGEDFEHIFHTRGNKNPEILPPYCELVKRATTPPLQGVALLQASQSLLKQHLQRMPQANPFTKFRARLETDLQWLANEPLETFHQYSFATLRQFGASYEVAAVYLKWLQAQGVNGLETSIESALSITTAAKTMQFQLARSMARKKPLDLQPIDQMAANWTIIAEQLKALFLS
jgi:Domain of unknown function (DUF1839)